ncbi:MAG: HNH endonuclease [Clostridia bacterium]|nr:HNH endonuclease [Clostridia bacterium]
MEIFEIPDFAGYYADKQGNIYTTLKKGCRDRFDLSKRTEPVKLKYRLTRKGYARVYMRRVSTNAREDVYVHRIIASIFIDNPNNYETVNHINSDRTDNRVENLEWLTIEDNLKHAMEFGSLGRDEFGRFVNKSN